eukprot:TRINITY_DN13407_c0_g1_i1.p1 TRINITY_DN13407_c0_g1~~TRINITY_DN13407_c0_g1_i1.p1  ORF type:complete len:226 (+),score=34.67 TRINITY_DN13407_c0_g1_i1:47-724(+)
MSQAGSPQRVRKVKYQVPRNEKGGIAVSKRELQAAFEFFDQKASGEITAADVRERMSHFYPDLTLRECKLLVSSEGPFTMQKLEMMLHDNELINFDPIREAFKIYDPHGTGYVDMDTLRQILGKIGHGALSSADIDVLISSADIDRDGRISIDDFAQMMNYSWEAPKLFAEADLAEVAKTQREQTRADRFATRPSPIKTHVSQSAAGAQQHSPASRLSVDSSFDD